LKVWKLQISDRIYAEFVLSGKKGWDLMTHFRLETVKVLAWCTALIVALWTSPGFVAGHAIIVDSSPKDGAVLSQAPDRIVLRFNSKVEKSLSRVSLSRGGGQPMPLRVSTAARGTAAAPEVLVVPLPRLKPGTYALRFTVLATDGHTTPGVLRFTIKEGTE
jgi:methionine-rich copper-binding protein CopC